MKISATRIFFTRQMATLLVAGLPLLKSLQLLEKEEKNSFFKKAIQQLIYSLEDGNSLSDAMKQHPALFPPVTLGMIRAGEQAGMLAMAFHRLLLLEEKEEKMRRKIVSITIYPLVILIMTGVIVVLLLTFVIPKFETIFRELFHGKTLPPSTTLLLKSSHAVTHHAWWFLGGVVFFLLLAKVIGRLRPKQLLSTRLLWRMPFLGSMLQKKELAHLFGVLGTLLENGVPLLQALHVVAGMSTSRGMQQVMVSIIQSIEEGDSITLPMKESFLFPSMVISMIAVGEETAQLPAMLLKIASIYEEDVDESLERLLSISEPLLLLLLAFLIGGIVLALFLPLVNLLGEM